MKITSIEAQARDPDRVNIHVDGEFRLALAAEVAFAVPLRTGDSVTDEQLRELADRDQLWRAREAALNLLSFRSRTALEMRRRLLEKGYAADVVELCVAELVERGLIDDASFAESFVRDRLRFRPRGAQMLLQELRTKGVDWDTARATVEGVLNDQDVSETELARQAAAKWTARTGETRLRARRRLYNFLARRGFGADAIREVVEDVLP
jgi:regulatory protein